MFYWANKLYLTIISFWLSGIKLNRRYTGTANVLSVGGMLVKACSHWNLFGMILLLRPHHDSPTFYRCYHLWMVHWLPTRRYWSWPLRGLCIWCLNRMERKQQQLPALLHLPCWNGSVIRLVISNEGDNSVIIPGLRSQTPWCYEIYLSHRFMFRNEPHKVMLRKILHCIDLIHRHIQLIKACLFDWVCVTMNSKTWNGITWLALDKLMANTVFMMCSFSPSFDWSKEFQSTLQLTHVKSF